MNKTGVLGPFGEAVETINGTIGGVITHAKGIPARRCKAGAAVAGVGDGVLGHRVQGRGGPSTTANRDREHREKLRRLFRADRGGDQTQRIVRTNGRFDTDALQDLTQATNDPAKALDLLSTATDLASAKHESLTTAAEAVGKAYNGNTKISKRVWESK